MTAFKLSDYRRPNYPLSARWLFAIALMVMMGGAKAEASIEGPAVPQFSLESSTIGAGATHSHEKRPPVYHQSNQEPKANLELTLLLSNHGPSSTSSTSGSSSLAGAGATVALSYVSTSVHCDPTVAGWVSGERQVALPSPPANELLRPPQAS